MMINRLILSPDWRQKNLKFIANENEGKVLLSGLLVKIQRVTSFLGEKMAMASKNYINSQSSAVIRRTIPLERINEQ